MNALADGTIISETAKPSTIELDTAILAAP